MIHARLLLAIVSVLGAAVRVQAAVPPAWVEMAPDGKSVVRTVVASPVCPRLVVDGRARAMERRAEPEVLPERTNKAGVATRAAFPSLVCELALPRTARRASLAGQPLPLPPRRIERIVLIGDTGCRLKAVADAWQDCNQPRAWPFAAIAARAAALHPDLVLHLGDYLYRENPCPAGREGCRDAVWGYGEASWRADFLDPAAPLLAATPWAMVRGNHEECARAGQGWWRLLDPHPLLPGRDCRQPDADRAGDHAPPYAVTLGDGSRLLMLDLVTLANGHPDDPATAATLRTDLQRIGELAGRSPPGFVAAHFPFNPVLWHGSGASEVRIGAKALAQAGESLPLHIRATLAGHIHMFQFARFADRPTQVIAGFSGTEEDAALAPATLAETTGKPGAQPLTALRTIANRFGFAMLERKSRGWTLTVFDAEGAIIDRFAV